MSLFPRNQIKNIAEPIQNWANLNPDKTAVIFIHNDNKEEIITHNTLYKNALRYASLFTEASVKPGDRIILALSHSKDLLYAIWGSFFIGAIPSIYSYKSPMQTSDSFCHQLADRINITSAKMALIPEELHTKTIENIKNFCQLSSPNQQSQAEDNNHFPQIYIPVSDEEPAYIQYTSGSSGKQKGVVLSHRAILNFGEISANTNGLDLREDDAIVNWLPLAHDFGLFCGHILPITCGIPTVLLSPFKWLANPGLYLELIQRYRGTITYLPNSGFQHILRWCAVKKPPKSNLQSLRIILNGSEPIFYSTLQKFTKYFESWGLNEYSMANGYGMAENTLAITYSHSPKPIEIDWIDSKKFTISGRAIPVSPGQKGSKPIVSCGTTLDDTEIIISAENGDSLPDRKIGEILVKSPTLFNKYLFPEEDDQEIIKNGWYHTGDLGYTVNGELYVCGRKKNIIIIGGQNIYPEDIEKSINILFDDKIKQVLALGITDKSQGTEKIVIVAELNNPITESSAAKLKKSIREKIYTEIGHPTGDIWLVEKRWIEKTINGKIDRKKNKEKYLRMLPR